MLNDNAHLECNQDETFLIKLIEENEVNEEMLCNSLGCA